MSVILGEAQDMTGVIAHNWDSIGGKGDVSAEACAGRRQPYAAELVNRAPTFTRISTGLLPSYQPADLLGASAAGTIGRPVMLCSKRFPN